jgi:hypothetical protein
LPAQLREILSKSAASRRARAVIWPIDEIERQNKLFRADEGFRSIYMPFDHLLFFGADAGGDQFAYAIQPNGKIRKKDVYRWEHGTDARSWFAMRLERTWSSG